MTPNEFPLVLDPATTYHLLSEIEHDRTVLASLYAIDPDVPELEGHFSLALWSSALHGPLRDACLDGHAYVLDEQGLRDLLLMTRIISSRLWSAFDHPTPPDAHLQYPRRLAAIENVHLELLEIERLAGLLDLATSNADAPDILAWQETSGPSQP